MADTEKLEEAVKQEMNGKAEEPQREFSAPKLPVETVVVYLDRAEVCRSFKTKVESGQSELLVKDLSQSIDKDSIRYFI
jgi:hypothetical protein